MTEATLKNITIYTARSKKLDNELVIAIRHTQDSETAIIDYRGQTQTATSRGAGGISVRETEAVTEAYLAFRLPATSIYMAEHNWQRRLDLGGWVITQRFV